MPVENILVADDNDQVRSFLAEYLRSLGHRVQTAANGEQAAALIRADAEGFALVISDLQMPRLDGLALLREIRRRGYGQGVVIQTTLLDASLEMVLRRAGASGVLMKGGPFPELVRSVEEAYRTPSRPPVLRA